MVLTYCGLVTAYGDIILGQHWLRLSFVAWRHQSITWTNLDHFRAISQDTPQQLPTNVSFKIIFKSNISLKSPGANGSIQSIHNNNKAQENTTHEQYS